MSSLLEPEDGPPSGPPLSLKIEVTSIDTHGILCEITRAIADRLLGENFDKNSLRRQAIDIVNAMVEARLQEVLAQRVEDLLAKPIQPRDEMGEPVGAPVTIKEIVASAGERFLTEAVDDKGRVAAGNRTYYNKDQFRPRVDHVVSSIVCAGLSKELHGHAEQMRAEIAAKAKAAVAELLSKARL